MHQADMENSAVQHGVKAGDEVATDVQNQRRHAETGVSRDRNSVISSGESSGKEYRDLQSEHEQGNKNFNAAISAEEKRQNDWIGDNSIGRKELNNIKDNLQRKFDQD